MGSILNPYPRWPIIWGMHWLHLDGSAFAVGYSCPSVRILDYAYPSLQLEPIDLIYCGGNAELNCSISVSYYHVDHALTYYGMIILFTGGAKKPNVNGF